MQKYCDFIILIFVIKSKTLDWFDQSAQRIRQMSLDKYRSQMFKGQGL